MAESYIVAIAGIVAAIALGGGGWMLFRGLTAARTARAAAADHARATALVQAAPAIWLLVHGDGRISGPVELAQRLGLDRLPDTLKDLAAHPDGFEPASSAAFDAAVATAMRSGQPFVEHLAMAGGNRYLTANGDRAPPAMQAPGGVLVWLIDDSARQQQLEAQTGAAREWRAAFHAVNDLIDAAPMPMWLRGADLQLAMVNRAYVAAVEAGSAMDVVTRQIELAEASGREGPIAQAAAARDDQAAIVVAAPATVAGERRMLRFHVLPLADGMTAGFAVDIDDFEQARSSLKRFGDAQRAMLDRLSAGVAQFGADRTLTFCNQPFRRIFGIKPELLADRPEFDRVLDRMREGQRVPEVRDFPSWKAERRDWFHAAEGGIEESWHLPGAVHLRVLAQPLPEGGLVLIFEDRTEQVQLASARDTLLRVRTATFENLSEALGVFAADGRIQLWNSKFAAALALDPESMASHPRVDALAAQVRGVLAKPAQADLIAVLVRSATVERAQRGGTLAMADGRLFQLNAVPLPDGNALLTLMDMTDSLRAQQALEERNQALVAADRIKTDFMANMSYELRTPLTSIAGFAEMLEAGYGGTLSQAGQGYAAAIVAASARLGTLIDDVLDLTASQDAEPVRQQVELGPLAQAAAEAVMPMITQRGITLEVNIRDTAGEIRADPRRIRQAMEHLLRHAAGGLADGARILLHVDGTARRARIVISDDGPGSDAGGRNRGTDLGLPLARQAIEAHGGTLKLVARAGEGTMLTAELPR